MASNGTERKFGYEWDIYREIIPIHKEQFLDWIQPFSLKEFKGKSFLDAGCGIGRNSTWPLESGAASGTSIDFDHRTVNVAKKNLEKFPNARVEFMSIYELPFVNEFDIVFCIGVIQHLENPRLAIEKLVRSLKPNGQLIIWVYAYEGNERYLKVFNPIRKYITSKIPLPFTRLLAQVLTIFLKIYLIFRKNKEYYRKLSQRSFRHTEAMVFDQLLPHIANYWTRSEVEDLFSDLPIKIEKITHTNEVSWTILGRKNESQ